MIHHSLYTLGGFLRASQGSLIFENVCRTVYTGILLQAFHDPILDGKTSSNFNSNKTKLRHSDDVRTCFPKPFHDPAAQDWSRSIDHNTCNRRLFYFLCWFF